MPTLTPYSEYRPTGFDSAGAFLPDQQDWLVAPCGQNRDSDHLTRSNWEQQLAAVTEVDRDGLDWEIHNFGHWACGWFEALLVRPDSPAATVCAELAERLEDYPVLDEEDYSRREWEAYQESWETGAVRDLSSLILRKWPQNYQVADCIAGASPELLREWYESQVSSGDYYDPENGCYPRLRMVVDRLERSELTALVRQIRKGETK